MKLSELFKICISLDYPDIGNSANHVTKRDGDTLYIFFEASDGKADWDVNLDFPAKAYKRMGNTAWFAHRGFLELWKKTETYLKDAIADKSINKIIITGFSHGAAMALLCHEYVWFNRPDLRSSLLGYGFGCPRVIWWLNKAELRARWASFTVIRNAEDVVTHLPPALLGYTHVGKMLEIGTRGKYSSTEAHYPENILKELNIYESRYIKNQR